MRDLALIDPRKVETEPSRQDVRELIDTLKQTNVLLSSIANTANGTLSFFRKWVPWLIALASIAYPSIGKIVDHLPIAK